MAYALDLVDAPITCHCWNKEGNLLALCPNTSDLLIYEVNGKTTKLLYTLSEHTQVISSCDWNFITGQIVTCSHDRNAYVWEFDESKKIWKKSLVLLKLNRAATYVRWAPDGKKFCVATGHKKFRICTYDEKQNWWQSYNIDNGHPTSLNVEFMSDNKHVICCSTDRHMGYYTIDEEEGKIEKKKGKKEVNFCLHEFSAQGWVNACTVSPDNKTIVYTSQDAYIRFINVDKMGDDSDKKMDINFNGVPLLSLQFVGNNALIGGGFDCQPRLFAKINDKWVDKGFIDTEAVREKAAASSGGGLAAKRAMFGGAKVTKVETLHNNIIVGVRRSGNIISTCANDGKIGIWPINVLKENFKDVNFE